MKIKFKYKCKTQLFFFFSSCFLFLSHSVFKWTKWYPMDFVQYNQISSAHLFFIANINQIIFRYRKKKQKCIQNSQVSYEKSHSWRINIPHCIIYTLYYTIFVYIFYLCSVFITFVRVSLARFFLFFGYTDSL